MSLLCHAGPANSSLSCWKWCLKAILYRKRACTCSKALGKFINYSKIRCQHPLSVLSHSHGIPAHMELPSSHLESHCAFPHKPCKSLRAPSTHFIPAVLVWNVLLQALLPAEQLCTFLTFKQFVTWGDQSRWKGSSQWLIINNSRQGRGNQSTCNCKQTGWWWKI